MQLLYYSALLQLTLTLLISYCTSIVVVASKEAENSDECVAPSTFRMERAQLFDYIYEQTLKREAFSPIKEQTLGINVTESMLAERESFLNTETDKDLYYALVRLSNVRKDRHLSVRPAQDGIWLDEYWGPRSTPVQQPPIKETPIKFAMDYNSEHVFVGDVSVDISTENEVSVGDKLVRINDVPFDDYVANLEPYVRYSTRNGLLCKVAERMNQWNYQTPPSFYQDNGTKMTYTLEQLDGTLYQVTLPFVPRSSIQWKGHGQPTYPNFSLVKSWSCFSAYLHEKYDVLLLQWHGFDKGLIDDIQHLMEYAKANNLLDHSLILDFCASRGGSKAAYALQHFTSRPFQTTLGNLRLSDVTKQFVKNQIKNNLSYYTKSEDDRNDEHKMLDDGTWLMDWIEAAVLPAIEQPNATYTYTDPVPFKLTHAPMDSDGMLHPAPVHFTGSIVALFGPYIGSQVDQLASIMVDNPSALDIYTIGMSPGGFSNTWEWTETLTFNKRPLVNYMWSIGQTIRPNGEILEGNPAVMHEYVSQTRDNYLTYRDDLVARAMRQLGHNEVDVVDE